MHSNKKTNATRFVLYSQDHEDQFVCVMEEWDGRRFVETSIRQRHARAIYALIDCKREAILADKWHERTSNTPPNAPKRRRSKRSMPTSPGAAQASAVAEGA